MCVYKDINIISVNRDVYILRMASQNSLSNFQLGACEVDNTIPEIKLNFQYLRPNFAIMSARLPAKLQAFDSSVATKGH